MHNQKELKLKKKNFQMETRIRKNRKLSQKLKKNEMQKLIKKKTSKIIF